MLQLYSCYSCTDIFKISIFTSEFSAFVVSTRCDPSTEMDNSNFEVIINMKETHPPPQTEKNPNLSVSGSVFVSADREGGGYRHGSVFVEVLRSSYLLSSEQSKKESA
jgi:hypothetical protein